MKRTINEIYNLINQKIENASNDYVRTCEEIKNTKFEPDVSIYDSINNSINKQSKAGKLLGEIEAYTDIKILIETSGVLEK